jgi:hypothetical protein
VPYNMPSSTKELKNIPVSISILHEQEYNNLCLILKDTRSKERKRRAFSERSSDKSDDGQEYLPRIPIEPRRRKTLKN